jgi:transcriptional regulator with XRE-family HTH domain
MADINVEVGALIRARRQKLKLTQTQLAEKSTDLAQSALAMYERGERALSVERLVAIADALGCSPCSLIPKRQP